MIFLIIQNHEDCLKAHPIYGTIYLCILQLFVLLLIIIDCKILLIMVRELSRDRNEMSKDDNKSGPITMEGWV